MAYEWCNLLGKGTQRQVSQERCWNHTHGRPGLRRDGNLITVLVVHNNPWDLDRNLEDVAWVCDAVGTEEAGNLPDRRGRPRRRPPQRNGGVANKRASRCTVAFLLLLVPSEAAARGIPSFQDPPAVRPQRPADRMPSLGAGVTGHRHMAANNAEL